MHVDRVQNPVEMAANRGSAGRDPEKAAEEFERILVKQFVRTMTEDLFKDSLSGDDGPSWMGAYSDLQRDALTDTLTDHLVDSGAMRLRDLLLRQWSVRSEQDGAASTDME